MAKLIGVVPARMASSRFPGKPLFPICGKPMVEHVMERSRLFERWDHLCLATCDTEIATFGASKEYRTIMTSDKHTRALDRVAEAATKVPGGVADDDIVVCVQGDEPMMRPDMIDAVVAPILQNPETEATVLAMDLVDEDIYRNSDTVKIVHDSRGRVLYTSRAPVPYCRPGAFSAKLGAKRIYGIFGFRWAFLRWFTGQPETPLEIKEACDSNRICDLRPLSQHVAPYPAVLSYSVDSPADRDKVEASMVRDPLWGRY